MRNFIAGAFTASLLLATGATGEDFSGHRFIDLDGHPVKWGAPAMGQGAKVRYAFVTAPVSDPTARNCGDMVPLDGLLEKSSISREVFRAETAAAFRMWEAVADISFEFTEDPAAAQILIGAQGRPTGRAFANVALRKGEAEDLKIKRLAKSLICFNPERQWKIGFDGDTRIYDLRYTMAHEIGHAIGLDHPSPSGQLMGFSYDEAHQELQRGDIAGAVALYGARPAAAPVIASAPASLSGPQPPASLKR